MKSQTYFTSKSGAACLISGDDEAVSALCAILEAADIPWLEEQGTWDEGFYREPDAVHIEGGWVDGMHSTQRPLP
jgi:hypothetical protein